MKINEVTENQLDEGPIDFVKKIGAGAKGLAQGGLQGAKAGWQQQDAANQQQDMVRSVSGDAGKSWGAMSKNIQMSTGKPPTADDAVKWYTQFSGQSPNKIPAGSSPAQINQWLNQEVAGYMQKKGSATQQPAEPTTAQPATANTATATTAQPTATTTAQPEPTATTEPIKPIAPTQAVQAPTAEVEPIDLPVPLEKLSAEERAELRRQLQASLKMAA
jgi:hypothetical protein